LTQNANTSDPMQYTFNSRPAIQVTRFQPCTVRYFC